MKYLIAKFKLNPNKEAARDLLIWSAGEAGFESFEETDEGFNAYVQEQLYDEQLLKNCLQDIELDNTSYSYTVEKMEDKNWNRAWEENGFDPIAIENRCIIYDNYHIPANLESYNIAINIDAQQAFGTGTHETTRMIVEQILSMELKGKAIADCGCGTGILSIVASKCGADHIFAYDIDDWSVRNTTHNAQINNVYNIKTAEGDSKVLLDYIQNFDILIANINRNILIADMPMFAKSIKQGGHIILSGFYSADVSMIAERAKAFNMQMIAEHTANDWTMIVLRQTES